MMKYIKNIFRGNLNEAISMVKIENWCNLDFHGKFVSGENWP